MALSPRSVAAIRYGLTVARRKLTPIGARVAVAQGWKESLLGMGGQFVLKGGRPSFNWGATTARSSGVPHFGGTDTYEGKPITQRWAGPWPSLYQGFDYWLSFPQVRRGLRFLNEGDLVGYSAIMHDGGYFTGRAGLTRAEKIADYAAMLRGGLRDVEEAERGALVAHGGILAAAGGAAWLAWRLSRGESVLPRQVPSWVP